MLRVPSEFVSILDAALTPLGYTKRGPTWRKEDDDGVLIVDLQLSNMGLVYVNFGVWYRMLGQESPGRLALFHAHARLSSLRPIERMSDDSNPMAHGALVLYTDGSAPQEACKQLVGLIMELGIPWLDGMRDPRTAREFYSRRTSRLVNVAPVAREFLGWARRPADLD